MDSALVVLSFVSTGLAVASLLFAWRLARDERARSEARVAALADDLDDDRGAASAGAAFLHVDAPAVEMGATNLFASSVSGQPSGRRYGPIVAVGALAIAAVVGTLVLGGSSDTPAASRPLELLSLRHAQQDGKTTITGLVRNPAGSDPVERLVAVVFFFDASGGFLTSARAPLDFTRLAAGEESPFSVGVTTPPGVGRYRVSFRQAEGGTVAHVDRREGER